MLIYALSFTNVDKILSQQMLEITEKYFKYALDVIKIQKAK